MFMDNYIPSLLYYLHSSFTHDPQLFSWGTYCTEFHGYIMRIVTDQDRINGWLIGRLKAMKCTGE